MKVGIWVSVLIFILIGSALPTTGYGESSSTHKLSILSGRIFDRNGAVVVGSEVLLAGDRGTRFGAVTDDEGIYSVDLPAGFYHLEIRANGFSTFALECYQIPSEGRVNLDVTLKVHNESGSESCPGTQNRKPDARLKKRKTIIIE